MSPFIVEAVMPFLAMMGLGGMVLVGMKLRYQHLQRIKGGGSSAEDVKRLAETVDGLRDEVRLMREEMLSINDRVEFTEKLLERPR
jgi:hypothetical protein